MLQIPMKDASSKWFKAEWKWNPASDGLTDMFIVSKILKHFFGTFPAHTKDGAQENQWNFTAEREIKK